MTSPAAALALQKPPLQCCLSEMGQPPALAAGWRGSVGNPTCTARLPPAAYIHKYKQITVTNNKIITEACGSTDMRRGIPCAVLYQHTYTHAFPPSTCSAFMPVPPAEKRLLMPPQGGCWPAYGEHLGEQLKLIGAGRRDPWSSEPLHAAAAGDLQKA